MEEISKLKDGINDFLSYTTTYIQDLQDKLAETTARNNRLQDENHRLRIALKYCKKR